ncbi:MAG: DoxX family protein [Bacteroidota bacterium]
MAILESLGKYRNTGILIVRIGLGVMMMVHGFPKITGGVEMWKGLGDSMKLIGIDFLPVVWGFIAAAVETFGGFLLVLGLFLRPVSLLLFLNMSMAAVVHLSNPKQGIMDASHAIELGFVFLGLMFIGAGKYSIDKK